MNDTSPIAVPGFLSQDVYSSVYFTVETLINTNLEEKQSPYEKHFIRKDENSFVMLLDQFDDYIYDEIQADVEGCFDYAVEKPEIAFVRINRKSIKSDNPLPQIDNVSRKNEAVLAVQLDSTSPWQISVAGKNVYTERNMGMFFLKPEEITWSQEEEFLNGDYCDFLLCRMSIKD
jgi:hypothetical protein